MTIGSKCENCIFYVPGDQRKSENYGNVGNCTYMLDGNVPFWASGNLIRRVASWEGANCGTWKRNRKKSTPV